MKLLFCCIQQKYCKSFDGFRPSFAHCFVGSCESGLLCSGTQGKCVVGAKPKRLSARTLPIERSSGWRKPERPPSGQIPLPKFVRIFSGRAEES